LHPLSPPAQQAITLATSKHQNFWSLSEGLVYRAFLPPHPFYFGDEIRPAGINDSFFYLMPTIEFSI
jgi:hypothetical protein